MGLRGIGAVPKAQLDQPKNERPDKLPWNKKGLERPARVIAFLEWLPVTSGPLAGKRMKMLPFQKKFIRNVYGPKRKDGSRIVTEALLTTAKKNGKTSFAAGLCLCHQSGPEAEPRGQVFSAATSRDQAALIFNEMEAMIRARPWLRRRLNIQRFKKIIEDIENGTIYMALSSDAGTAQGKGASFWVYDELGEAPNSKLYDNLSSSGGGRVESLGLVISTQAEDDQQVLSEQIDSAIEIERGNIIDPSYYSQLHILPPGADTWDEKVWPLANPALGKFRSLEDMRAAARKAKRMPSRKAAFERLFLNKRVNTTSHLIEPADWEACGGKVDVDALEGLECYGGLDLSERGDLTSLELVFPRDDGYDVLSYFWLPNQGLAEKGLADRVPYTTWADDGHLLTTPGRSIRYRHIAPKLQEILETFDVRAIAFDRFRIKQFLDALEDANENEVADIEIDRDEKDVEVTLMDTRLIPFGQGYVSQSPAVDNLENAIVDGELSHAMHPVLTWNAANVVVSSDGSGNRKFRKDKARGRIDGMVALAQALTIAPAREKKDEASVYETEELLVL